MFRLNLKTSIATGAVIAGVLAVAGPASASSTPLQNSMVSGVVQAPGGQDSVGEDVQGFIESQYVPTLAEAVIGVAPNGGLAHEREPGAASSAAQKAGPSNTLMVGLTDDHTNVLHAEMWFGDTPGLAGGDTDDMSLSVSSHPAQPAHAITMLDDNGSPLKADSNEVADQGVTATTPSLTAEGHLYAGVARTSAGFKSLSGMDSETEFMYYTDDSLLD